MTSKHSRHGFRLLPIWAGALSLVLGFPLLALASGYGHGSAHPATGSSSAHHGSSAKRHGGGYPGGNMNGGHGMKGSMGGGIHGPHQSASKFIDHILKFKDGMAITDDQAAKLHTIKTGFEKTKIKMKADFQLISLDLHDLLRNDKGALSEIESTLKNLYDTRAKMYFESVKATRDAKAVLTTEQRARMKTVHDRINAYKDSGMEGKGHHREYKHHKKGQNG